MKKAKLMCCLLVLILLVSGCSDAPASGAEPPTSQSSVSTFPIPDIPDVTLDSFPILAEGIYCTGGNYNIAIYPFSYTQFFYVDLFSETPLPEDTSVRLDTPIPYHASISEVKPVGTVEVQYPYYLYQCTQGTDWPTMTEAYFKAQYATYERNNLLREGISPSQEQEAHWKQDVDSYTRLFTACEEAYLNQVAQWKNAAQPSAYHYRIGINFAGWNGSVSDTISEATLVYDGKTLTVPIGAVHLDGNAVCRYPVGNGITMQTLSIAEYPGGTPWGTECMEISAPITITAKQNVKIKNLFFYNNTVEISKCIVLLNSMGAAVDLVWSPNKDAIDLQNGDQITFYITIKDEDLTSREYAKNLALILEYEQDGETYCDNMDIQIIRRREPYEVFLWAFQQVNTQAYYQQFLNIAKRATFVGG